MSKKIDEIEFPFIIDELHPEWVEIVRNRIQ